MEIGSALAFIFFIVLPACAIWGFTSKLTSGVYHWADRQHPEPEFYYEETTTTTYAPNITPTQRQASPKPKTKTKKREKRANKKVLRHPLARTDRDLMENYLGYDLTYKDSKDFKRFLDTQQFDVRDYLKR